MQSKNNVIQLTLFVFFNNFTDGISLAQGKWQIPSMPEGERVRGVDRASLPRPYNVVSVAFTQACMNSLALLYFVLVLC